MKLKHFLWTVLLIALSGLATGLAWNEFRTEILTGNGVMGVMALINGLTGYRLLKTGSLQNVLALISLSLLVKMLGVAVVLVFAGLSGSVSVLATGISIIVFYILYTTADVWFLYQQTKT